MNEIFVTNHNDFAHEDGFDGERFVFPAGEKVMIPVLAARHMFGFGNPDKTDTLLRLGWANLAENEGVKRLANFVFTEAQVIERVVEDAAA